MPRDLVRPATGWALVVTNRRGGWIPVGLVRRTRKEVVQEILAGYTPKSGRKFLDRNLKSGEWRIAKVKIEALQ